MKKEDKKKPKEIVLKVKSIKSKKNWISKAYPNGPKWTGD
jgi:hypothetical protein